VPFTVHCSLPLPLDNRLDKIPYLTAVRALGVCAHHARRRGWVLFD
jgi:hypothetical protein